MKYYFNNVLVISDNQVLLERVYNILLKKEFFRFINFSFAYSSQATMDTTVVPNLRQINIAENLFGISEKYDLIISLHCKQIFPKELIKKIKCINIHPGFNPYNRGWYPHVFSMINKLPAGVTIHEMDEKIDHGPIIVQKEIKIHSHDTSADLYGKIIELEIMLFSKYIESILQNSYGAHTPLQDGNINLKKDFDDMKIIHAKKMYSGQEIIDLLRALTHNQYNNAYFLDENNKKIFIKIILRREDNA